MVERRGLVGVLLGVVACVALGCGPDPGHDGDGDDGRGDAGDFNNLIFGDAGDDAGDDAGPGDDVAVDASPDLGEDAPEDVAPDVAEDAVPDVAEDVAPDIEPDIEPDVEPDAEPDAPADERYASVEGLTGAAFEAGLLDLIDEHRVFAYTEARDLMYGRSASIDVNDAMIECVYTGRRVSPDGSRTPGGFNTEHSWPRNEGADTEPMVSDLHHLFPSDADANNARGTEEFGETDCTSSCEYSRGGSQLGPNAEGPGTVFEVRQETRGDIARAHFYFAVRYERAIATGEEAALRRWHVEDPPDDLERSRNNQIERFQRNRNPFVDRPDFVDRIENF